MSEFCKQPFTAIEIGTNGNVYTCCPPFINEYKIGNIFEDSVEDIWYSEAAKELRRRIINGDYSLCNKEMCRQYFPTDIPFENPEMPPYPEFVTLSYDRECNLCCISCRDEKVINSKETLEKYNSKIDDVILPLLKNAKIIAPNGSGEALVSRHSRLLIKKIAEKYKNIYFHMNTNGLLFNEKNIKELGIYGRINTVCVSLPALDPDLYHKIMRGSNLNTVLENIKWMATEYGKTINAITINCVISSLNYKEIPALIKFASSLSIQISLSPFEDWDSKFAKEYNWKIWDKNHPEYNNFVKIIKEAPNYDKLFLPYIFQEIQGIQKKKIKLKDAVIRKIISNKASMRLRIKSVYQSQEDGYSKLNSDTNKIKQFFITNGIEEKNIEVSQINNNNNEIYRDITISTNDIDKIEKLSIEAHKLINQNIDLSIYNIKYYLSDIDKLKKDLSKEALKYVEDRAQDKLKRINCKIGTMTESKIEKIQILPARAQVIPNDSIDDTTSKEKKIVITISATFTIRPLFS